MPRYFIKIRTEYIRLIGSTYTKCESKRDATPFLYKGEAIHEAYIRGLDDFRIVLA